MGSAFGKEITGSEIRSCISSCASGIPLALNWKAEIHKLTYCFYNRKFGFLFLLKTYPHPRLLLTEHFSKQNMVMAVSLMLTTFLRLSADCFSSPQSSWSVQWSSVLKSQQLLKPCMTRMTVLTSSWVAEEDCVWLELQQIISEEDFHYWNAEQPLGQLSTLVKVPWSKLATSDGCLSWLKSTSDTVAQCSSSWIYLVTTQDLLATCPIYLCCCVCTGYLMDCEDAVLILLSLWNVMRSKLKMLYV